MRYSALLVLIILLLFSTLSFAQQWLKLEVDESGERTLVSQQYADSDVVRTPLKKIAKGTLLFHWTRNKVSADHRLSQGFISEEEARLLRAEPRGNSNGGGVYLSTNIYDSSGFGNILLVFEMTRDTWVVDYDHSAKANDRNLFIATIGETLGKLLELGISGITNSSSIYGSWFNIYDSNSLGKIRRGSVSDLLLPQNIRITQITSSTHPLEYIPRFGQNCHRLVLKTLEESL